MELLYSIENLAKSATVVVPFILAFCLFDEVKREKECKKRYVAIYSVMIVASIIFYRSL